MSFSGSENEPPHPSPLRSQAAAPERDPLPLSDETRKWEFFVTGTGRRHAPAGAAGRGEFAPAAGRVLNDHQLVYISAGQGEFESEPSGRRTVRGGNILLLYPSVWHRYTPDDATVWDEQWISFNGDIARRLIRKCPFTPEKPVCAGEENRLLAMFTEVQAISRSGHPAARLMMATATMRILDALTPAQQPNLVGGSNALSVIRKAIARMHQGAKMTLNIPDLARELNVSYRWFRRAFVSHTGMSPHGYLLETRLAQARDMLARTSLSIKEIAYQVGFEDAQYFCRLFHKKVGMTPGTWRQRTQNSLPPE